MFQVGLSILSLKNSFFLLSLIFFVAGCGFHPVYSPSSFNAISFPEQNNTISQDLALIKINLIPDRKGQLLRNALIHSLTPKGQPGNPQYILLVNLKEESKALGILKDATYSRSQLTFTADFSLISTTTNQVLLSAQAITTSNFNFITSNQFATIVADDDAHARGLELLAQDIARQIAMYFSSAKK